MHADARYANQVDGRDTAISRGPKQAGEEKDVADVRAPVNTFKVLSSYTSAR